MSGRKDLSWVSLFVSSCIRARRKSKTEKTRFSSEIISSNCGYIRVLTRFKVVNYEISSAKTATRSPSSVRRQCHAGELLAATFRDNVEPGWIGLLPLRLLKNAVSHARRGRGTPTKKKGKKKREIVLRGIRCQKCPSTKVCARGSFNVCLVRI